MSKELKVGLKFRLKSDNWSDAFRGKYFRIKALSENNQYIVAEALQDIFHDNRVLLRAKGHTEDFFIAKQNQKELMDLIKEENKNPKWL